jgi:hypothetical protein
MKMWKRQGLLWKKNHLGFTMIAEEMNMEKEMGRQILTTNLNVKKACQNGPEVSTRFYAENKYQHLITFCNLQNLNPVTFSFSKNWKVCSMEPIFNQMKTSVRKWQMTSGDASRPRRLVWWCVTSDGNYLEGDNMQIQ